MPSSNFLGQDGKTNFEKSSYNKFYMISNMNMDQTATGGKRWPQGKIRPFVYTLVLPNFITFIICHFELYILLILELLFKI
jgi:hypothetical protein